MLLQAAATDEAIRAVEGSLTFGATTVSNLFTSHEGKLPAMVKAVTALITFSLNDIRVGPSALFT